VVATAEDYNESFLSPS